jgi:phosphoglycerate dehydrogenase-like enzyme
MHSWAAGPNAQLFPAMVESPAPLTCSKGNGAIPLAEHAMMLMMMLNRNAMRWINAQRERKWDPFFHGELNGLTCAILGAGHSGQDLALKAKAFHMRVVGLRRNGQPTPGFDQMYTREQLGDFLSAADFLVVTAPNTPETRDMLGEAEFRQMKPTAYYVCFSRGGIANDAALLRALQEGWIAGAGLDAQGVEPLPADSPFWTAPNTIITPHNGATTLATKTRGYEIFRDNLARYVRGEPLQNVVDKRAGY